MADGYVSGGTRRNLGWVAPHLSSAVGEDELLLLADAQTSGGLLLAGEIATGGAAGLGARGAVIGEFVARRSAVLEVR